MIGLRTWLTKSARRTRKALVVALAFPPLAGCGGDIDELGEVVQLRLEVLSGAGQKGLPHIELPLPIVFGVYEHGRQIAGITVEFKVVDANASGMSEVALVERGWANGRLTSPSDASSPSCGTVLNPEAASDDLGWASARVVTAGDPCRRVFLGARASLYDAVAYSYVLIIGESELAKEGANAAPLVTTVE